VKTFLPLSLTQLNWKLNPDSWSVGECFSHLVKTNNLYLAKMEKLVNSNSLTSEKDFLYNQSFMGELIAKGVDPGNVRKVNTFKAFSPDSSDINKSIIDDYVKLSETLIALAEKCVILILKK